MLVRGSKRSLARLLDIRILRVQLQRQLSLAPRLPISDPSVEPEKGAISAPREVPQMPRNVPKYRQPGNNSNDTWDRPQLSMSIEQLDDPKPMSTHQVSFIIQPMLKSGMASARDAIK